MLDYAGLEALAAVLREGSFERAARKLHVTPSAISQRIKLLEERVGQVLVLRGTPCTGTEAGRRLCLHVEQVALLEHQLRRSHSVLYRCWQLKEGLRDLYRLPDPSQAAGHLDWWLAWACRSRIPAFVTLSKTVRDNRDRILAAVELGLSNSKLEGLNSKIRLINHRGYGHHSAAAVIAMIYLCCGGLTIQLPTER